MASRSGIPRPKRTSTKPKIEGIDVEEAGDVRDYTNALYPKHPGIDKSSLDMDEYDLYISQKSLQLKKAMKETPYYLQRKQEQIPHIHKARNERTLRDATSSFTHFPEELIVKTRRRPVKERLSMDIEFNEEAGEDKSDEEQAEQDGEEVFVEEDDLDEEDDYAFQNFDDDEDIVDDNDYDAEPTL